MLGTRKKQTIPASRASRLVHPQAMGTILVPHSNTSISYRGPCIAICIESWKRLVTVAALLSGSLSNHSLRASSPGVECWRIFLDLSFQGLHPCSKFKSKRKRQGNSWTCVHILCYVSHFRKFHIIFLYIFQLTLSE